jgi:hypothetical protein
MVRVKPNELSKAVLKELDRYTENVSENVDKAVGEVAKESRKKLKAVQQVEKSNIWVNYPRGWTIKSKKSKRRRTETVWNAKHYRLTHLLENGHVIKNGTGRTYGRTNKFVHIGPINDEAQKKLEDAVMEAIEKG